VSENAPHVSVIIVTHNSMPALADCLISLRSTSDIASTELIAVDNASSDSSTDEVVEQFPDATVIHRERNDGFATACNEGAQSAQGEFLLFLNPDVQLDNDAVERLVSVTARHDRAGLVSGRLRFPDGSFQATCRRFPTIGNMVFSRGSAISRLFGAGSGKINRYTLPDSIEPTEVPAVAATMVMIRKALFDEVGGFDSRFFMFMEDTDLSLRLYQSQYSNLFVPAAGAIHCWGRGSSIGRLRRLRYHHVSVWRYFLKHFPNGFSVILLPILLVLNFLMLVVLPGRKQELN
jgi:GT2 family glycosyltransferase